MSSSVNTAVLEVDPDAPQPDVIALAADVLRSGGLVAFPTETVYGLGANALDHAAVARIFAAKGRPPNNPLIVHVADAAAAQALVVDWPERAARLASRYWPGPLTLVLPKAPHVPDMVTAGGPTVAVRVPLHPVARALLLASGLPIAAPSANRSNHVSPTCAEHVAADLAGRIELILDGGPASGGIESTVIDPCASPPRVLRPGPIPPSEITAVLGEQVATTALTQEQSALPSPGMFARHYSPRARLEIVAGSGHVRAHTLAESGVRVGWLSYGDAPAAPNIAHTAMPTDADQYAHRLYAALRDLDSRGVAYIIVDALPEGEAWMAVRDRLQRASTPGS